MSKQIEYIYNSEESGTTYSHVIKSLTFNNVEIHGKVLSWNNVSGARFYLETSIDGVHWVHKVNDKILFNLTNNKTILTLDKMNSLGRYLRFKETCIVPKDVDSDIACSVKFSLVLKK